jgi:hypothetical protein
MLPILALCLALGTVAAAPVIPRATLAGVPDEPGAFALPARPTLQAVVADLEGTGVRDLVRLVEDGRRGRVVAEVWRHDGGRWDRLGDDLEVVPPLAGGSQDTAFIGGTPVRLLVRAEGDRERVTVVRQPHFEAPGREPVCCLLLQDVVVVGDRVGLQAVGSDPEAVDSIHAIDLDGDGTDELLASRSLPPLGRTAYPSEALVFRWLGQSFGAATLTELPIGSGDTPFVLGETDGRPGEEAGVITTAAQSTLHRLVLDEDDRVRVEEAGRAARDATAVVLSDGPGIAVIGPVAGLAVHRWPAGEPLGPPLAQRSIARARLLGPVTLDNGPAVLVEEREGAPITAFGLPDLHAEAFRGSAAAAALAKGPLRPYRGPLPGGGPGGGTAAIVDGTLLPGGDAPPGAAPMPIVALGDVQPVGLAGPGRDWLVLAHRLALGSPQDPAGGRLAATPPATGSVTVAPLDLVTSAEADGGAWAPEVTDAVRLDEAGTLGISAGGFGVVVEAPSGSRLHAGVGDGSGALGLHHVPANGRLEIHLPLPRVLLPYGGDRFWLGLVTPAGATYTATLEVLALTGPPPLEATARTQLGSTAVEIRGRTVPYASVEIDGRLAGVDASGAFAARVDAPPWPTELEVVATDPAGNVARARLSAIGVLDYRALPWVPITVVLLIVAGIALYVRAPRVGSARVPSDDGTGLEDLDPEREL